MPRLGWEQATSLNAVRLNAFHHKDRRFNPPSYEWVFPGRSCVTERRGTAGRVVPPSPLTDGLPQTAASAVAPLNPE